MQELNLSVIARVVIILSILLGLNIIQALICITIVFITDQLIVTLLDSILKKTQSKGDN